MNIVSNLATRDLEHHADPRRSLLNWFVLSFRQHWYRLVGTVGKENNLTGQENVIFQQLMYSPKPRSISDLSRFTNRDDISNIQYSLRKLTAAGLIEKVPGSTNRDTRYQPTAAGQKLTDELVALRRELLIGPSSNLSDIEAQLKAASTALSLITGLYDHVSRVLVGRF